MLPPQEIGGLLNSTLSNALRKKMRDNITMRMAALAELDEQGEHYDPDKMAALTSALNTPSIITPPVYNDPVTLQKQISLMERKRHPLTNEGVVIYNYKGKPLKSKLINEADVVIRNIFPADSKDPRAGGFDYSLPGSDKVVGRVGSGFDHSTLKDMMTNPDKYIGRTARVTNYGQFDEGAYRSPSFIALHEG